MSDTQGFICIATHVSISFEVLFQVWKPSPPKEESGSPAVELQTHYHGTYPNTRSHHPGRGPGILCDESDTSSGPAFAFANAHNARGA